MRALLTGVAAGLAIVVLALLGGRWWLERHVREILARRYDVPLTPIGVPTDSLSIAEGERRGGSLAARAATTRNCRERSS